MRAARRRPRMAGVTLVELVVVLTVVAVMASLGATLVTRIVAGQLDNQGRLALAATTDAALARVADELQTALPNSLRLTTNADGVWIEWVPVLDAGRYRQAADTVSADPGDPLDLEDATDSSFDIIGTPLATPAAGSQLVIANLGTPDADAYLGQNRRGGLVLAAGGRRLSFTPAGALPAVAGTARFFVVGGPVTLACVASATPGRQELRRYSGYGWQAAQPATVAALAAAGSELLAGNLSACSAAYSTALANIGLLNLRLEAAAADGPTRMALLQQTAIDNTP